MVDGGLVDHVEEVAVSASPGVAGTARLISMERAARLTAVVTYEGDWYVARALEVELTSQGASVEESLANLREAPELYFEDQPFPATAADGPIVAPLDIRLSA
jgi:predicted RNase H-like HicB family nuclease